MHAECNRAEKITWFIRANASVYEHQLDSSALCGLITVSLQERTLQKFLRKWNIFETVSVKMKCSI